MNSALILVAEAKESTKDSRIDRLTISGTITEGKDLRYTPGGIAVWEGTLHHASEAFEAGAARRLEFDFSAIAFSDAAIRLAKEPVGRSLQMIGFIAPRSVRTQRLVVHITEYKEI